MPVPLPHAPVCCSDALNVLRARRRRDFPVLMRRLQHVLIGSILSVSCSEFMIPDTPEKARAFCREQCGSVKAEPTGLLVSPDGVKCLCTLP